VQIKILRSKFEVLNLSNAERERKIDLYSFQAREIEDTELETGKDEKLESDISKLKNAVKISALPQEIFFLRCILLKIRFWANILKTKKILKQ
jgi:DNA repair protein RecN (Recombination protein N)